MALHFEFYYFKDLTQVKKTPINLGVFMVNCVPECHLHGTVKVFSIHQFEDTVDDALSI